MQLLKPQLTAELTAHMRDRDVWRAPAYKVATYRDLVEQVAQLSYLNRNQLLFFRGQDRDYQSRAEGSTLYPAIYRGDALTDAELDYRFKQLDAAAQVLVELFERQEVDGVRDVARKRYIQWSVLQHYEVVDTPLLDVTQSLRVACSFAQRAYRAGIARVGTSSQQDAKCYVFVLGLPYLTNRISINSEEDVVNIRLLSICPPAALRPYFQEGYMAGTPDITARYEVKTELDFRNRLIAKFAIPSVKKFWNSGFTSMPPTSLYPSSDRIHALCEVVKANMRVEPTRGDFGQFLLEWGLLEERLLGPARRLTERNISAGQAIDTLVQKDRLLAAIAEELHAIRRIRNAAAHRPTEVDDMQITAALHRLRKVAKQIPPLAAR